MKRLCTIILMFCALTLQAQDLKSLFIAMPDSLSPLLTTVNRQDFGDFLASNMKAEVKNRLGETSEMTKLTEDYLHLQLTAVSEVEMKLLPVNDSTQVICVAKTYSGPVKDTTLKFYTTSWKELPASDFIQLPEQDAFYVTPTTPEKRDSLEQLKVKADIYFLKGSLSAEAPTLCFSCTVSEFLDKETADLIRPYLRQEPLCYEWKNGRFDQK